MSSRHLNYKESFFLFFALIFVSPSFLHFCLLAQGIQPDLKYKIPLSGSLLQQTLLFDRPREFFRQHHFLIIKSTGSKDISREEFFQKVPSYFERILFWHWAGYTSRPAMAEALLRHYFCSEPKVMPNGEIERVKVEWQIVAPRTGAIEWRVITVCRS